MTNVISSQWNLNNWNLTGHWSLGFGIFKAMKIALAYDYLNQLGGGERVLEVLAGMFPEAPIYTIFYDKEKTRQKFISRNIHTSFLDRQFVRNNHRAFIPLFPTAVGSLNLGNQYDLIISAGAGYSHGISHSKNTKHIHYCFTPLRYAWEEHYIKSKFKNQNTKLMNLFFKPVTGYLRNWDYRAAQGPDRIIAISDFIANRIKKYYQREADVVIYPPLDTQKFFFNPTIKTQDYFLAAGRLLHYKKFDLVIESFNQLGWPLKIIGAGPDEPRLKKLIQSPKIEMLGFVESDEVVRHIYSGARGFIFPQLEDFGLVGAEAQSCGCPIIGYAAGGALEIIKEGESGVFFQRQTREDLIMALKKFKQMSFNRQQISQLAQRFSIDNFKNNLQKIVKTIII
ncbi:MAG: glycosyltransferase [Patescibacteria group bacterium]